VCVCVLCVQGLSTCYSSTHMHVRLHARTYACMHAHTHTPYLQTKWSCTCNSPYSRTPRPRRAHTQALLLTTRPPRSVAPSIKPLAAVLLVLFGWGGERDMTFDRILVTASSLSYMKRTLIICFCFVHMHACLQRAIGGLWHTRLL
jgi:hypothetical protein